MRVKLNVDLKLPSGSRASLPPAEHMFRVVFFFTHAEEHGLAPLASIALEMHLLIGKYQTSTGEVGLLVCLYSGELGEPDNTVMHMLTHPRVAHLERLSMSLVLSEPETHVTPSIVIEGCSIRGLFLIPGNP
jgi:hypothetical protein